MTQDGTGLRLAATKTPTGRPRDRNAYLDPGGTAVIGSDKLQQSISVAGVAVLTLTLMAAPGSAQRDAPQTTLSAPVATVAEPFSGIAGFRVLSDGRVLVADPIEQALWRVDPASGTKEQLGRQGQGPGEYEMPGGLFGLPGDTTLMLDRLNRRLTMVLPDGRLSTSTIPLRMPSGMPMFPRGVDHEGRIYFDLAGIQMPGLEETAASGRAPLLRWHPATDAIDTLGVVAFPPLPGRLGPGEMRVSIGGSGPYSGRDEWAVTPDGRVGVARYQDYHVEWLSAGAEPVVGPPVRYEPVTIGRAEKEAWADQLARRGLVVEVENGRRRVGRPPRPDIEQQEFPEVMPPFLNGAATTGPNGGLWIERARAAHAEERVYDVFDHEGRLVRQVVTPANVRLLGFGDGTVYAARIDENDLEWLEVYRMDG
jgi:hypothetical protein